MENEGKWIAAIGGRKFLISILALVAITFFIDLPGESKMNAILGIVGIFAGANVSQKVLGGLRNAPELGKTADGPATT